MSASLQKLIANVGNLPYDSLGIQKHIHGMIRDARDGVIDLVDASNPLVLCAESQAALIAASMIHTRAQTRQMYPLSAQVMSELYPHMSDLDYTDRFAIPATTTMLFLFSEQELLSKLVTEPDNSGIRKITIPRNTYVEVGGVRFGLHYPIEIRQMIHDGLQIVYNVEKVSPLQTLTSNVVPWQIITADTGERFIAFEVAMEQFRVDSRGQKINLAQELRLAIDLVDQYQFCRVWKEESDGSFTEIATTHTEEIYDLNKLTAALQVTETQLIVKIPQIYVNRGMINTAIRVDVYQSRGPINMELSKYLPDEFVATWATLDPAENDQFVTPLNSIRSMFIQSKASVNGGRNAMTFEELQSRVIRNGQGDPDLPVTNVQIEDALSRAGYKLVKNIDNITNRSFLATREMPEPVNSELITAAAGGMVTLAAKVEDAVLLSTVVDNGDIVTITPKTLYKLDGGLVKFVSDAERTTVEALSPDNKATVVTNGNYLYSPFHYALDSANNRFSIRPYYLDTPDVLWKSFIAENDTTLLQVTTNSYVVERTLTGYKITILTRSSDAFKELPDSEVNVQLAFIPPGEIDRAYILGTLIDTNDDGERMYEFVLDTNLRLSAEHELGMTSFRMYSNDERVVDMPLRTDFDILYSTNTPKNIDWRASDFELYLGMFQLPQDSYGVTREKLSVHFGYYLEHLWARSRSVVSEENYEKWATDVPATYATDVYEQDPQTGSKFSIVNGELVYNILHHAGDPVLNNGVPVMKHYKGDIKHDSYGNPIVIGNRAMLRQMDLLLIEGTYYFADDEVAVEYTKSLVKSLVQRLVEDMVRMGDTLIEQSTLSYYPTSTIGAMNVMFGAGLITSIIAGQAFKVTIFVRKNVYDNLELRDTLSRKTISTIGNALKAKTVSISDIIELLKVQYGKDAIGLDMTGLGGASNLKVVTVVDDSRRLSIRKRLIASNDEKLRLQEDVTVEFINHERSNLQAG